MKSSDRESFINAAAYQYFRDVADGDYIMARSAFFMLLMPQFFHSTQQCLEKYMKCILVLHRVNTKKLGHDLKSILEHVENIGKILICERTKKFIKEMNDVKEKYLETSYCIFGHECAFLDKAVWELRRYCVPRQELSDVDNVFLDLDMNDKDTVIHVVQRSVTGRDLLLPGGNLEKILEAPDSPSRKNLIHENAFFGDLRDIKVHGIQGRFENTMLHAVNDESLYYELCKYITMPDRKTFFDIAKMNDAVNSQRLEGAKNSEVMGSIRQELLSGKSSSAMIEERKKEYRNPV